MTNYETIQKMSIEDVACEMVKIADCICGVDGECTNCPLGYIEQEIPCTYAGFVEWLNKEKVAK